MEENKLFNEIKSAAENAETKDFPGMEKVWQRVEEKLDKKDDKIAIWRWKKIAVAASILLVATLGYQFFKNNSNDVKTNEIVTSNDSIQKASPENAVVTSDSINPSIKSNAEQILHRQIISSPAVAMEDIKANDDKNTNADNVVPSSSGYFSAPAAAQIESHDNENIASKSKKADVKEVELFMDKRGQVSNEKKEEPLVVIEGKVARKKLEHIEFSEADSLVVLKEPLYIINGVEYSEQQVFGPNPTSPYTPLNKQEIETISILQDEKAIEIYGKKGSKGVVIITTKNGKPVSALKKAK